MLNKFRRQQLTDIARAFEIPVPVAATKHQLIDAMRAHEQQGVFHQPAKHPYYLARAGWTTDAARHAIMANPENEVAEAPPAPVIEAPSVNLRTKRRGASHFNVLQKQAKAMGINTYGMKKHQIEAAIHEHEHGEGLRQGQDERDGEAGGGESLDEPLGSPVAPTR